jgi:hypothetical protein
VCKNTFAFNKPFVAELAVPQFLPFFAYKNPVIKIIFNFFCVIRTVKNYFSTIAESNFSFTGMLEGHILLYLDCVKVGKLPLWDNGKIIPVGQLENS